MTLRYCYSIISRYIRTCVKHPETRAYMLDSAMRRYMPALAGMDSIGRASFCKVLVNILAVYR